MAEITLERAPYTVLLTDSEDLIVNTESLRRYSVLNLALDAAGASVTVTAFGETLDDTVSTDFTDKEGKLIILPGVSLPLSPNDGIFRFRTAADSVLLTFFAGEKNTTNQ